MYDIHVLTRSGLSFEVTILSKFKFRKKLRPKNKDILCPACLCVCVCVSLTIFHLYKALMSKDKDIEDCLTEREEWTMPSYIRA